MFICDSHFNQIFMRNFLRFGFVLLFIFWGFDGVGQRKLPYPILLVHGWAGSDETWNRVLEEFQTIGLNVDYNPYRNGGNGGAGDGSRIDICLNSDNDNTVSNMATDINYYYNSLLNVNNDVFVINFNVSNQNSSQSAITKQGEAVGFAIQQVLSRTGADKIILMGHSMGGLAIREYLQNPIHWHYSTHHVAKLVTNATPHGGSDSGTILNTAFLGYDQRSEAVRDLRTSYPKTLIYNQHNGVYLFGGDETLDYIHKDAASNFLGLTYRNLDVNCNGQEGDHILGLNERDLHDDIPFANIIGTYFGTATDQIVSNQSANLNNIYTGSSVNDIFIKDVTDSEYSFPQELTWHSSLAKQKVLNMLALDEPSTFDFAYQVNVNATSSKKGLFTKQSNNTTSDRDRYKVYLQRGITNIQVNGADYSYPRIEFYNPYRTYIGGVSASGNYNSYTISNSYTGTHFFDFIGESGTSWRAYNYDVHNQQSADLYSNKTSICVGDLVRLDASESGFDYYEWYKNGQYFTTTTNNYLNATTTGVGTTTFTVKTYKWGAGIFANNSKQVNTYAPLSPPTLTAANYPEGTTSTTGLNICDGTTIVLTTNCPMGTASAVYDGTSWNISSSRYFYVNASTKSYVAQCGNYYCSSANSSPVRIVNEPNIQSTKSGDWQDPTMWINNYVPLNCQTVTIQTGHTVNVSINDAKAKNIIIKGKLNFINVSPSVKGKVGLGI